MASTLQDFRPLTTESDWRELADTEIPRQGDVVDINGAKDICCSMEAGKTVQQIREQIRPVKYYRCTLGTFQNPHRPEHFD